MPAFAQAVTTTSVGVEAAFTAVQSTYYNAQVTNYAVTYTGNFDPAKLKTSWLPAETMNVRLLILSGLRQYASELSTLTASNVDSLDSATTTLGASLTSFTNTPPFTHVANNANVPIQIATTAVNALGKWLIERKLEKELPSAIVKMDPTIQSICQLLVGDIGSVGADPAHPTEGSGLRQVQWAEYNLQIKSWNDYVLANKDKYGPEAKLTAIKQLVALADQQKTADQTLPQVAVTIKQLAQAHSELVVAAKTKQALRTDLSGLIAEAQRLAAYYQSLANSK